MHIYLKFPATHYNRTHSFEAGVIRTGGRTFVHHKPSGNYSHNPGEIAHGLLNLLPDVRTGGKDLLVFVTGMFGGRKVPMMLQVRSMEQYYLKSGNTRIGAVLWLEWGGNYLRYAQNLAELMRNIPQFEIATQALSRLHAEGVPITLAALSMGGRAAQIMAEKYSGPSPLCREVLLIAADNDCDVFQQENPSNAFLRFGEHIHVFSDAHDRVLRVSERINNKKRIGQMPLIPEHLRDRITSHDFTSRRDDFHLPGKITRHSYFRSSHSAIEKIRGILKAH